MSFDDTSAKYFFIYGGMGISIALANAGSAYGSFRAAIGIATVGTFDEKKLVRSIVPVVMAGILGIYGLIIAIQIQATANKDKVELPDGFRCFFAGMVCGGGALAAGLAIGAAGDLLVRAFAQ